MPILPIVTTITSDEPAYSLAEVNLVAPDGKGWWRYQVIQVVRGDKLAEYRERLGPTNAFQCIQFFIPGGLATGNGHVEIYHTVGELKEVADKARLDGLDNELAHRPLPDYGRLLYDKLEDLQLWRLRHSTFGPRTKTQRS